MAYEKTNWVNGTTAVNQTNMNKIEDELEALDTGKVDVVSGKGLSTNDFTNEEKTKVDSAYQKSATGIPETDLADSVQASLDLADSAVQPSAISDMATKTWVGNQGYLTSHQDISGKADKTYVDSQDTALSSRITTIANDIDAIEAKIPTQATSSNQLADKDFVNSSIASNTATFRGTSASGLTEALFLAWANGLSKTNNDYVFWNTTDTDGNVVYKRYKYNGTDWVFEYSLNNSAFTASQWSALNSGITSEKVSTYDAKVSCTDATVGGFGYTKNTGTVSSLSDLGITATATELNYCDGVTSNVQTQLDAKQPTLTAGTGISIVNNVISINLTNANTESF